MTIKKRRRYELYMYNKKTAWQTTFLFFRLAEHLIMFEINLYPCMPYAFIYKHKYRTNGHHIHLLMTHTYIDFLRLFSSSLFIWIEQLVIIKISDNYTEKWTDWNTFTENTPNAYISNKRLFWAFYLFSSNLNDRLILVNSNQ